MANTTFSGPIRAGNILDTTGAATVTVLYIQNNNLS